MHFGGHLLLRDRHCQTRLHQCLVATSIINDLACLPMWNPKCWPLRLRWNCSDLGVMAFKNLLRIIQSFYLLHVCSNCCALTRSCLLAVWLIVICNLISPLQVTRILLNCPEWWTHNHRFGSVSVLYPKPDCVTFLDLPIGFRPHLISKAL